jgi:branched-chain amino acid transport system substrate-binding protein
LPLLTSADQPGIHRTAGHSNRPCIFRTCYTDEFQGKLMADGAYHDRGYRRAAVLASISEAYSKILAQHFSSNFVLDGGRAVDEQGYIGTATDFAQIPTPLKSLKPDIIRVQGSGAVHVFDKQSSLIRIGRASLFALAHR